MTKKSNVMTKYDNRTKYEKWMKNPHHPFPNSD